MRNFNQQEEDADRIINSGDLPRTESGKVDTDALAVQKRKGLSRESATAWLKWDKKRRWEHEQLCFEHRKDDPKDPKWKYSLPYTLEEMAMYNACTYVLKSR